MKDVTRASATGAAATGASASGTTLREQRPSAPLPGRICTRSACHGRCGSAGRISVTAHRRAGGRAGQFSRGRQSQGACARATGISFC